MLRSKVKGQRSRSLGQKRKTDANCFEKPVQHLASHRQECEYIIHCVSKNVPPVTCYNLDSHDPITSSSGARSFSSSTPVGKSAHAV